MSSPADDYRDLTRRGRGRRITTAKALEVVMHGGITEVVRRVELASWQSVTSANPVDTGFSRSKWTPTTGSSIGGRLNRPEDRRAAVSDASRSFAANRARAEQIAKTYLLPQGQVFITNPTSYLPALNGGSSAQAPAHWIERAIAAAIRFVARAA